LLPAVKGSEFKHGHKTRLAQRTAHIAPHFAGGVAHPATTPIRQLKLLSMAATAEPLALSRRRLSDAVHAFADPLPVFEAGNLRTIPPVYTRLRGALRGATIRMGRRSPTSRQPTGSSPPIEKRWRDVKSGRIKQEVP
jgi:hypothetical protein